MDLSDFVKETIREGGLYLNWLEMIKNELTPLFRSKLKHLLSGYAFIMITDRKREWFEKYFLANINANYGLRPLLPFFSLNSMGLTYKYKNQEEIEALNDFLSLSYPNGFLYFYVGDSKSNALNIAKSKDESFIWLFDEQLSDSLYIDSKSKQANADIKLITLFELFDTCVEACIFNKVQL